MERERDKYKVVAVMDGNRLVDIELEFERGVFSLAPVLLDEGSVVHVMGHALRAEIHCEVDELRIQDA